MIISENQIKVHGKRFKTKVSCVSTRRLTTIEWLLLSCTKKFSSSTSKSYLVRDVFENVFQFQNSELLIKPCLKSLASINVIIVKGGQVYNYDSLQFSEIVLTELGQVMLKDGLLPGEHRDIAVDVYYNPLIEKITTYDWQSSINEGIELGVDSDYNLEFPAQKIVDGLQSGAILSGRFTAAKYKIEKIEKVSEYDWECISDIAIDLDESGELHANPDIVEGVSAKVGDLLKTKEISDKQLETMTSIDECEVGIVRGSGPSIKSAIQDICINAKVIFIHNDIYESYKRNTSFFKNKIVIVYSAKNDFEYDIKKEKKDVRRFIFLSEKFTIPGVVLINDKGDSLSVCRAEWRFKDSKIAAPVAIEDKRMHPANRILGTWIGEYVKRNLESDTSYLALLCLPGINPNKKEVLAVLEKKWNNADIDTIIADIRKEKNICDQIGVMPYDISALQKVWEEKLELDNPDIALKQLNEAVMVELLSKRSTEYGSIIKSLIPKIDKPNSYTELVSLSQRLGISSYEEVTAIDGVEEELYTESVFEDILFSIVRGDSFRIPLLYNWDYFFTEYVNCLRFIEAHIDGQSLFEYISEEEMKKKVVLCPNLGSLQMYVSELISKNAYLMDCGVNAHSIMSKENEERADAFFTNIKTIEEALRTTINDAYRTVMSRDIKSGKSGERKVYIIDTCALIHKPNIFMFFSDDEYIRIPTKVIDELGKIKDNRSDKYGMETSSTARMIARNINEEYMSLFNSNNKVRFLIENANINLLPKDLDPNVPDNQILSVALKYSGYEAIIISDDSVFHLTTNAQNIKAISSDEFVETHRQFYKSLEDRKKKVKSCPPVVRLHMEAEKQEKKVDASNEQGGDAGVFDRPIKDLAKYAPELTNPVMSFLSANSIRMVSQFKALTEERVDMLKAKGAQEVYKNAIKSALSRIDQIIDKLENEKNG